MARLDRFKEAQERPSGGFRSALAELEAGGKQGHWIWYIFPQLAGLGYSPASNFYAIADIPEAEEYLHDPVLRERLIAVAAAVADLQKSGDSLLDIMSGSIDAMKLISSLTLFGSVAQNLHAKAADSDYRRLAELAEGVLAKAESEGYTRCQYTLGRLKAYAQTSGNQR